MRDGWGHAPVFPPLFRIPAVPDKQTPASPVQPRPRRTQASRSNAMRARLLKAAIQSLNRDGYAATTTTRVCELAKVSRGAMLHHFPSRVDLMLHVVRAVYDDEQVAYRKVLDEVPDLHERTLMLPELLWEILGRPSGVAVLEIMQGARSDKDLSPRLKILQRELERDSLVRAAALIGKAKVSPDMARLMVWSVRGLSIARLLAAKPEDVEGSVRLFKEMLRVSLEAELI